MRIQKKTIIYVLLILQCFSALATDISLPPSVFPPLVTATPLAPTEIPLPTSTPSLVLDRAQYTLNTIIDYDGHTINVDETILYPNLTGNQLNTLVLAIVPNLWPNSFNMESIAIDGLPTTTYSITGQRLDVSLSSLLPAGGVIKINIQYTLALPFAEQENPNISRPRIFGYTARQLNLTNWYPFVVPFINGEWVLHDPWYYGEHLVYDTSDYEVNVKFVESEFKPIVAASGLPEQLGDSTRYTIASARTFALSASPEFQVANTQVGDISVSSYYFPFDEAGGQAALQVAAESALVFSQTFGPYPHKTLSIVMGDFNDGMEYSAFFYLSKDFYNLYDGTFANYITFVAAHETAHQWWFEAVASDQALQPWVDESLSTYSERIYYETAHPDLVNWWWTYRINFYNPQGFVDIPVYEGQGFRTYTDAVYFQGAIFLEKLREQIGNEAFFAFLQDYLAQGRGKIVTAGDFFRILGEHTDVDYSDLVRQYFQNNY